MSVGRPALLKTCLNILCLVSNRARLAWHFNCLADWLFDTLRFGQVAMTWSLSCRTHHYGAYRYNKRGSVWPLTAWISLADRPFNRHSARLTVITGFGETYNTRWEVPAKVQCLADSRWWQVLGEILAGGNTVGGRSRRGWKSRRKKRMDLNTVIFSRSLADTKEPPI